MWYTKNLRIVQAQTDKLTQFKNWLKDKAPLFSNYIKAVDDNFDINDIDKQFQYTLQDGSTHTQSLDEISKTGIRLTRENKVGKQEKAPAGAAPKAGNVTGYELENGGYSYTQELNSDKTKFVQPRDATTQQNDLNSQNQPAQQVTLDTSGVKANKGQKNKALELISPKDSNELLVFDFTDEYVEDYNKLVDAEYSMVITVTPDNSAKGYNLEVSIGNTPAGVDPNFIQLLKNYIINNAVFKLATDEKGDFKQSEYTTLFKLKTNITPAQFQKTFITPTLINSRIGDPIKLKIDGRDIKTVRNGENVILDPNDLYLTKGKHIIEFVSNNADQNLNADKSDFLSYQINVTDGQKLSLIGSARGSFPNLYNRAPPSTERQRTEQELRDRRRPPTKETDNQKIAIEDALRIEAIANGLFTQVYNTAMQKYDFNEVEQYIEEIMRNRALYATPQKRKDYAESLKRERGRVRQQSPVDALLQPRPTQPGA
jgi:hypothetical protein